MLELRLLLTLPRQPFAPRFLHRSFLRPHVFLDFLGDVLEALAFLEPFVHRFSALPHAVRGFGEFFLEVSEDTCGGESISCTQKQRAVLINSPRYELTEISIVCPVRSERSSPGGKYVTFAGLLGRGNRGRPVPRDSDTPSYAGLFQYYLHQSPYVAQ